MTQEQLAYFCSKNKSWFLDFHSSTRCNGGQLQPKEIVILGREWSCSSVQPCRPDNYPIYLRLGRALSSPCFAGVRRERKVDAGQDGSWFWGSIPSQGDHLWDGTIHAWPVNGASWLLFNNGLSVFRLTYNPQPSWHLFFGFFLCFSSLLLAS